MKKILILILIVLSINAYANDSTYLSTTISTIPKIDMNVDSLGFAISDEGVGIISIANNKSSNIILYKLENGEVIAIIGNADEPDPNEINGYVSDIPNGIIVSNSGKTVFINAEKVIIKRREFNSHSEAESVLNINELYYLRGDRNVYRVLGEPIID
jgi:hypothetical protein